MHNLCLLLLAHVPEQRRGEGKNGKKKKKKITVCEMKTTTGACNAEGEDEGEERTSQIRP
jgi:hypothetical protein